MALHPQPWAHIAHRLFHFPGGTPRAATAPTRPPPTIVHRGSSGRFSLGLRWGQRLWMDHFRIPDTQPCLEARACLARAQPQWGGHGRHTALVASSREAQGARVLCLLTSRLIYLLCWATKRIFKTQNSRKLSKGFGGVGALVATRQIPCREPPSPRHRQEGPSAPSPEEYTHPDLPSKVYLLET